EHQSTFLESNIELLNNIDLGSFSWVPFGQVSHPFTGTFNGNGNVITHLQVNAKVDGYVGFFGEVDGTVENVVVEGTVTGSGSAQMVGGLVGELYGGTVTNASMAGSVSGSSRTWVGGLVGESYGSVINSHSTAKVSGGSANGGLVGADFGSITNSYATGEVSGPKGYYNGGLAGYVWDGTVSDSYSTGDVTGGGGTTYQGAFVGYLEYGKISNSYSWGSSTVPSGATYNGGFVGIDGGTIQNSYSLGQVSGGQTVSPFASVYASGTVHGAFYDSDDAPLASGVAGAQGASTAAMKSEATFAAQRWDFRNTWGINPDVNDGFPYLRALASSYSSGAPANDLPEVPNAVDIPLIGLTSVAILAVMDRRRRARRARMN
ncbi:MAG: hypothetical protein OWT27_08240, partial [Firmicutes bacterium]|nr:hypothetical protein [Bacillota bacterium]